MGKQLKCQEVGSYSGCPLCYDMRGANRKELSKVIYHGHRQGLEMNHFCRSIGHSTQCCPPQNRDNFVEHEDYLEYLNSFDQKAHAEDDKKAVKKMLNYRNKEKISKKRRNVNDDDFEYCRGLREKITVCDKSFVMNLEDFRAGNLIWHHNDHGSSPCNEPEQKYHPAKMRNEMWYEHCDFRPRVEFKRRTQQQFEGEGRKADNMKKDAANKGKVIEVNGVKGSWGFSKLKYADVTADVSFDVAHCLSGLSKNLIDLTKAGTTLKNPEKLAVSCVNNDTHYPFMYKNPVEYPWKITPKDQTFIDQCIGAILVPASYSDDFQIKNIYSGTGNLRSKAKIMVFTVLIDFINLFLKVSEGYKVFFSMFGSDLNDLLSSEFDDESIACLLSKLKETVSVYEGMFGDGECKFLLHEVVHVPDQILQLGPASGWWTFSGERALGFVKKMKTLGGQSFDKTMMNRYDAAENGKISRFYSCSNKAQQLRELGLTELDGRLCHLTHYIRLAGCLNGGQTITYNAYEMNKYLLALRKHVLNISGSEDAAIQKSPFIRLCTAFDHVLPHLQRQEKDYDFFSWLTVIVAAADGKILHCDQQKVMDISKKCILNDGKPLKVGSYAPKDAATAKSILDFSSAKLYSYAYFNGMRFRGRGFGFAEICAPKKTFLRYGTEQFLWEIHNVQNIIGSNCWVSKQYSSWCRYRSTFHRSRAATKYAQISYFLRVNAPEDPMLHGTALAYIISRKHSLENYVARIECADSIYKPEDFDLFLPVSSIYPSPQLVVPFTKNKEPIGPKESNNHDNISKLYLIDLYPNCKHFVHETDSMQYYNKSDWDSASHEES